LRGGHGVRRADRGYDRAEFRQPGCGDARARLGRVGTRARSDRDPGRVERVTGTALAPARRERLVRWLAVRAPRARSRRTDACVSGKTGIEWSDVTETTVVSSIEDLKQLVGQETRIGDWHLVTQEEINQFADATGDHQWIHVDPERAKAGPFGGTIAHGFWTLSSAPFIMRGGSGGQGVPGPLPRPMGVNYRVGSVPVFSPRRPPPGRLPRPPRLS